MRIAIPLYERYTALDAIGPYEVLSRLPGAEIVFCAHEARPYRTDTNSIAIVADKRLDEIDACDILLVPGGLGTRAVARDDERLLDWIRRMHETTTWTTSVCTGALLLAAAGVLDGVDATTHWAAKDDLEELGARYMPQRVVERGKIMTAAGVSAGIDMGLTLAARVAGDDVARAIQLGIEYDPQPPFDAGSPAKAGPDIVSLVMAVTSGSRVDPVS